MTTIAEYRRRMDIIARTLLPRIIKTYREECLSDVAAAFSDARLPTMATSHEELIETFNGDIIDVANHNNVENHSVQMYMHVTTSGRNIYLLTGLGTMCVESFTHLPFGEDRLIDGRISFDRSNPSEVTLALAARVFDSSSADVKLRRFIDTYGGV